MMTTAELPDVTSWQRVSTGDECVGVAERPALGTTARVAVWPPEHLDRALAAVDEVLGDLDHQASRFRNDSELSWINRADGGLFLLSDGLTQAIGVALAAARWTRGLTDPTVGDALIGLGYDRDFSAIDPDRPEPPARTAPAPGWRAVELAGFMLRLPAGVRLDLGATAKGLGSDRAVRAAMSACRQSGGILVGLGGDIAVAGTPPRGGWPVTVTDEGDEADGVGGADARPQQLIRLPAGAVATSSTGGRRWRRSGRVLHHIVDPRTGLPAAGPWRLASVAAATCADANAAATAAIVAGRGAEDWLAAAGLPARLASHDGGVRYVGGWPADDGGQVMIPAGTHVYGGTVPLGGPR